MAAPKISAPLNRATRALAAREAPTTAKLSAYVSASPILSNAPESREDEPLMIAAATIMRNVAAFIPRTRARTPPLTLLQRLCVNLVLATMVAHCVNLYGQSVRL
jgi:hypothetical protein